MIERFARFRPLFDAFARAGHSIYIVGGCVRDAVMESDRPGDVDLATDARPEQTRAILESNGFKSYPIGERFGTITTLLGDDTVEITTFRVGEVYTPGSRHPQVVFGDDIVADLSRRDLSINAMAMAPDGAIIDPFDGRRAIQEGILEVPGGGFDNTLSILRDDPLRLLRIARFAARFGFHPTRDTTEAARTMAPELLSISRERWKMELDKLLVGDHVEVGVVWLAHVGALGVVLPVAVALDDAAVARLCRRLTCASVDTTTRWAVLLGTCAELAQPAMDAEGLGALAQQTGAAFRFSNRERKSLVQRLSWWPPPGAAIAAWPDSTLRRAYVRAPYDVWAQLELAACLGDGDPAVEGAVAEAKGRLKALLDDGDPTPRLPPRFGRLVQAQLGLTGPEVGGAIERVMNAILDGELPNGASAETYLAFLTASLGAGGSS